MSISPSQLAKEILNHTNILQQDYHVRAWVLEEKIKLLPRPKYDLVYDDISEELLKK